MRNKKSYQAIDCKAIICEGLSKWIDSEKLSNKIVAVVSMMEVPLLKRLMNLSSVLLQIKARRHGVTSELEA